MITPTLGHFWHALSPYEVTGAEPALSSIVVDSREARPGSLFVALPGERVNGHDYVRDAFDRGAVVALIDQTGDYGCAQIDLRDFSTAGINAWDGSLPVCLLVANAVEALQKAAQMWRDQFDVQVIGITGSVGKSSTKELTATVLSQRYNIFKSPGNRNSILGLPPALFDLRPEHEYAVLEMGMYTTGEIAQLCAMTKPIIGVVTMIGPVHLERAGTMETIIAAKRELVEALPHDGVAILNYDDDRVMEMSKFTQARVFTYGLSSQANLWADQIHSMGLSGVRFTFHHGHEAVTLSVPMLGRHSVHTALRATAVGLMADLSWDEIAAGLSENSLAEFRLVAVSGPHQSIIIDDTYNSSPDSALAALNLLSEIDGRKIAVLGDMLELGQVEEESHKLIGRRAADTAQLLIAIGPRSQTMAVEARKVGMPESAVYWVETVPEAIPILEKTIGPNDVILIKGSYGMRMDRLVSVLGKDA